jgi:hypothetical protein
MRVRVLSGIFIQIDGTLMRRRQLELGQTLEERGFEEGSVSAGLEPRRRATGKRFPGVRKQNLRRDIVESSGPSGRVKPVGSKAQVAETTLNISRGIVSRETGARRGKRDLEGGTKPMEG